MYRITNWLEYQHYGEHRAPPWIKLHYKTLSGQTWVMLDDASRVLMVACMLVASQNKGCIPSDPEYIKRVAYLKKVDFKPLIEIGFLEFIDDASNTLATASALLSLSTSSSSSKKGGAGEKKNSPDLVFELPDIIPKKDWDDFVAMRRALKKPLTQRAGEITIEKLTKWFAAGHNPSEILQNSIANNWQGLFEPKTKGNYNGNNTSGQNASHIGGVTSFNGAVGSRSIHQPSLAATEFRRKGIADAVRRIEARRNPGMADALDAIGQLPGVAAVGADIAAD